MERGDRVVGTAILSVIVIIAIIAIVIQTGGTPTAEVIMSDDFIGNGYGTPCESLYYQCENLQVPYYLGRSGYSVECCCPENYKGERGGSRCMRPKRVII